jgi:amino acid permease
MRNLIVILSVVTIAFFGYLNFFQDFSDLKKKEEQLSSAVPVNQYICNP